MLNMKLAALRLAMGAGVVGLLGGCASFDFGMKSDADQPSRASAGGAVGGTKIVGTVLMPVPSDDWSTVLSNHTPQRLRLFVTLLGAGPVELRWSPAGGACPASAPPPLSRRGQSAVAMLDAGCALQASAPARAQPNEQNDTRPKLPPLLRVQAEAPTVER